MKKCIVIPDSFKGSLDSIEICEIARSEISRFYPDCEIITLPVADGGEGTVECFLQAIGGERVKLSVKGPYMDEMTAEYAVTGDTAIIETASCAGLPLVEDNKNPCKTTTYGVGEQMRHAVENGAKKIILGLGGSATNDCGCGCAAALGVVFKNAAGESFVPTGDTLSQVADIDVSAAKQLLKNCEITAMCDIDNPMHGERGAAYVFAPQKGADEQTVKLLDGELKAMEKTIENCLGIKGLADVPGTGAAGAMGAGVMAFLGAELKPGIEAVLDTVEFDHKLAGADAVFTGEGKIDSQSLRGKVVIGVARRAQKQDVPVIAIVGDVADDAYEAYDKGVSAIFSINRLAVPFSVAKTRSRHDYQHTLEDILRLLKKMK